MKKQCQVCLKDFEDFELADHVRKEHFEK